MKPICCKIHYEKKWRNKHEYRKVPVLTCEEFNLSISGDGFEVKKMAKAIKEAGADTNRLFHVFNGDILAFTPIKLSLWTDPPDRRPEYLK